VMPRLVGQGQAMNEVMAYRMAVVAGNSGHGWPSAGVPAAGARRSLHVPCSRRPGRCRGHARRRSPVPGRGRCRGVRWWIR